MAYTDSEGKIILKAWHPFRGYAYGALTCGELCAQDTTNEGFIPADDSDSKPAVAIAMEDIAAAGTGWLCRAALVGCQPSESGGVWSDGAFFASTDVTSYLYVGESGLVELAAGGTYKQLAGFVVSTSQMYLDPMGDISNTAGWFEGATASGAVSANDVIVGKNHNVTLTKGNLTLTNGSVVHTAGGYTMTAGDFSVTTGNINISTAGNINLTKGDMGLASGNLNLDDGSIVMTAGGPTLTAGNMTLSKGDLVLTNGYVKNVLETKITETKTLTAAQCGVINVKPGADTVLTLPTAAAGLRYDIVHFSGAHNINIKAGASDYILYGGNAKNNLIHNDKGADCRVTLRAMDSTHWLAHPVLGDWTSANA